MVLKLRLARVSTPGGAKRHHPRYNIVLAHARTARDSRPLEVLGTYNPIPELPIGAEPGAKKQKDIKVDVSRAKYWLGVGAQPSDTVWRLLSMIGLLEPRYLPTGPQTEKALKAVRFPTHQLRSEALQSSTRRTGQPLQILDAIERTQRNAGVPRKEPEVGEVAGTTSPQNPNEA